MILYCAHYFFVFLFGAVLADAIGIRNPKFWMLIVLGAIVLTTNIMLDGVVQKAGILVKTK